MRGWAGPVSFIVQPSDAQFLANIYSNDVTSDESTLEIQSLLSSLPKIITAKNLLGNDAQAFVDFLDQVSRLSPHPFASDGVK